MERKTMNNRLFVYGILKRGYELDVSHYGAKFLQEATLNSAVLYGIGRRWDHEGHPNDGREYSGVGLRFTANLEDKVHGELWEIPEKLWPWLDQIENNGITYTRKLVDDEFASAWVYEHTYRHFPQENVIKNGRF